MNRPSAAEVDRLKCRLYNEFYKKNMELFIKDGVEYWRELRRDVEPKIRDYIYTGKELIIDKN